MFLESIATFGILCTCLPVPHQESQPIVVRDARVSLIHDVAVPALESGAVTGIHVTLGQSVSAGDVVGSLDVTGFLLDQKSHDIELEIARLRSENEINYLFAEKSYAVADARLARAQGAAEAYARSVTQSELDELSLSADRAQLQMQQSLFDREVADLDVGLQQQLAAIAALRVRNGQIVAPRAGMIVQIDFEVGEWVRTGDQVARLVALDELYIDGYLDAGPGDQSLVGRTITFEATEPVDSRGTIYRGEVVFVSPLIDSVHVQVAIRARIDNHDLQLRPGTVGQLRVGPASSAADDSTAAN